jgi:SulP family sulfate permease
MVVDALVLGMLGCIDALLTSVVADSLTRKRHNSNKELVGQGIGNMMSGLFGGLPGAGATMGTVVNIQTGARTAVSGVTRAVILLVVVLWAAGLTATIPLAVLAGIAIKVGLDIIDWGFLRRAHRISGKGALIMYGVIGLTVFVDLITAVGIGLFVANVITITRLSELQAADVQAVTGAADESLDFSPRERALLYTAHGRVLLLHLRGTMIFGASRAITRKNSEQTGCEALVIDLSEVRHLGVSAALALEAAAEDMIQAGRPVIVAAGDGQPRKRLADLGLLGRLPEGSVFASRESALERAVAYLDAAGGIDRSDDNAGIDGARKAE